MTVSEMAEKLNMRILTCPQKAEEKEVTGCYICDLLSWVIGRCRPGDAWITIQTNVNVLAVAVLTDCACVVIPEGIRLEEQLLVKAADQEVILVGTDLSAFDAACGLKSIF